MNLYLQKYLLEKQAVVDVDGGKLLNEDNDLRPVSMKVEAIAIQQSIINQFFEVL